jgi:DNA-binding IclR family transcriptional regulator
MTAQTSYREAVARAEIAKAQLRKSAQDTKERVSPARLKQDVKDKISGAAKRGVTRVSDKARQNPVAVGAAGTAFILFLARRPLTALFKRLYVRFTNARSHELENDNG